MSYEAWKGKFDFDIPAGSEALVTAQMMIDDNGELVEFVELAFRPVGARAWGPPVALVRAP